MNYLQNIPPIPFDPEFDQNEIIDNLIENNNRNRIMMAMQFQTSFLKAIPTFAGEAQTLGDFITSCDLIIDQFYNNQEDNFLNRFLITSIKSKLTGRARNVIGSRELNDWPTMRQLLQNNFADLRDENSLLRDLMLLRQKPNESSLTYSNRCLDLKSLLLSKLTVNENNAIVRQTKQNMYDSLTLKAFMAGLNEPFGSVVRARNPPTLELAVNQILEEENISYLRNNLYKPNTQSLKSEVNLRVNNNPNLGRSNHNNNTRSTNFRFNNPPVNQRENNYSRGNNYTNNNYNRYVPNINRQQLPQFNPRNQYQNNYRSNNSYNREVNQPRNNYQTPNESINRNVAEPMDWSNHMAAFPKNE